MFWFALVTDTTYSQGNVHYSSTGGGRLWERWGLERFATYIWQLAKEVHLFSTWKIYEKYPKPVFWGGFGKYFVKKIEICFLGGWEGGIHLHALVLRYPSSPHKKVNGPYPPGYITHVDIRGHVTDHIQTITLAFLVPKWTFSTLKKKYVFITKVWHNCTQFGKFLFTEYSKRSIFLALKLKNMPKRKYFWAFPVLGGGIV